MKKVVLFALLVAVTAGIAEARVNPLCNVNYRCYYSNSPIPVPNPSFSTFGSCANYTYLIRGIEQFQRYYQGNVILDNRKFTFGNDPNDPTRQDYIDPTYGTWATDWEFTINPEGPQCKRATVTLYGQVIRFKECSDGHSRTCYAW